MLDQFITQGISVVLFGAVGWWVRHDIVGRLDKIAQKVDQFREEMIRDYATKTDVDKTERENHASHAVFWDHINKMRDEITVIKTVQGNCRSCRGEK